jgi:hypothetical protein
MEFGLSSDICELLRAEAFAGLKALPRRGVEVGGLLTHRIGAGSTEMASGVEPIPCEYLYGPSYRLSPFDYQNFRARIRAIQAADAVKIAFFFRSSTREVFGVTPEDVAVAELLSDTAGIVLIRPSLNGNATFRVFQSTKDCEWYDFEEFEVRNELIVPAPLIAAVAAPKTGDGPGLLESPPLDSPGRRSVDTPRLDMRFAGNSFALFWLILVLAVAASVIVRRAFWNIASQVVPSNDPDLGMQVVFRGNNLLLTWNQSLPSVRNSAGGNLQIRDGAQYREIALDSAQLAQAVIYYAPNSDDITFRLNIQGQRPSRLSGIVRVLANHKDAGPVSSSSGPTVVFPSISEPLSEPVSEPHTNAPGAGQGRLGTPKSSQTRRPPQPSKSAEQRKYATGRAASNAPKRLAAQFNPGVRPNAPSNPDERGLQRSAEAASSGPQAPDFDGSSGPRAKSAPEISFPPHADNSLRITTSAEPDISGVRLITTVSVEPAGRTGLKNTLKDLSPRHVLRLHSADSKLIPSRALRQTHPELPSHLISEIHGEKQIKVKVTIDPEGEVVKSELVSGRSDDEIAAAVLYAARNWTFEPARMDGRAVESKAILRFALRARSVE